MYATVVANRVKFHEGLLPTLEQLQQVVGGYIETADRFQTARKNITVDVYCNEEGHILGLPLTYFNQNLSPIAGDLALVGGNNATGASVHLWHDELWTALKQMGFNEHDEVDS